MPAWLMPGSCFRALEESLVNTTPHPDQFDLSTCRMPSGSPVVANRVMEKGCTFELDQLAIAYGIGAVVNSVDQ